MALNLIIGRSNSGKSEYIMKKIMACNKQAILFVPSSMRIIAEQEYLKYTNKRGIADVVITSIERFADRNVNKNELYNSKEYMPELAKKLLIRKVILENGDMFEIFSKVKNNTNFVDRICSYIDSAKNERISAEEILEKYDEQDFLGKKLKEFASIYSKVEQVVGDRFVSSIDILEYYIKQITNDKNLYNYEIFFDGYNNFSKMEFEYINALLLTGKNVTITLEIDINKHTSGETEIFTTTYETIESLRKMATRIGVQVNEINLNTLKNNRRKDLEFLSTNIFDLSKRTYKGQAENVKLVLKENTYNELEYIAADITSKIKKGYRYKDFVIYTNDIELYLTGIEKIFSMYNIPIYFNLGQNILSSNIVTYILIMLKIIVEGFKKDITPVLSLIKTGLIELESTEEFENYVREFGINGYSMEKTFTHNNKSEKGYIYNLENINSVRQKVIDNIYELKKSLANVKNSKDITKGIYEHLLNMGIVSRYEKKLVQVQAESVNEYNRQIQTLGKLYEVMDNIVLAYDEVTLKEYLELLEYGAKEIKIDTIPEKIDQVYISDINKNRGTEKKIGYIIGAYDGGLPSIQNEDNIFSDAELKRLKELDIDLKQSKADRNNMQLFNIYQSVNKIRDELIITVPSSKMSGGRLRPSPLIQTIKNLLDIKLESVPTDMDSNINASFMNYITRITAINENTTKEELEQMYNEYLFYMANDKYRKILEYAREDKNLESDTLELIYRDKINSSVSRLEYFKRCPFAYYSRYILNLKETKEYKVTTLDLGTLMHGALEEISKYIIAKNISWQDIVLEEKVRKQCFKELDNIVEKIFNDNYSKYLVTPRYIVLKNKVKSGMRKTVYAIADSFNHSEFRPLGYEISFEEDALFAPIKIELDNGKSIFLRGKIDRVDSASINGNTYLRVVDYKSSQKDLKLQDIKDGLSLQLMTYMWAMLENSKKISNNEPVIPAALNYFTISSKLLTIPNYEENETKLGTLLIDALKLKGIFIKDVEILSKMDTNYNDNSKSYLWVNNMKLKNESKVLPEDTFVQECNNMRKVLKEIAKDMIDGNVKICPNKKKKDVCKYCEFSSMCRKEILN